MMRAKLKVTNVTELRSRDYENANQDLVTFTAVGKNDYSEDVLDENNTYAKYTPSADLKITIQNEKLLGQFQIGDEFYVDFTKVSE